MAKLTFSTEIKKLFGSYFISHPQKGSVLFHLEHREAEILCKDRLLFRIARIIGHKFPESPRISFVLFAFDNQMTFVFLDTHKAKTPQNTHFYRVEILRESNGLISG